MRVKDFDVNKTASVLLYTTQKLSSVREVDFMYLFKILYFADQKHLIRYGKFILPDQYIAMKDGPVPSLVYDCLKAMRGDGFTNPAFTNVYKSFEVYNGFYIKPIADADLDYLSKSELKCLDESITEYSSMSSKDLSKISHDAAWGSSTKDDRINVLDIAKAAGASEGILAYIHNSEENSSIEIK